MSPLSLEKLGHNLPASSLAGFSQAALGFGAGLLLAGCMNSKAREKLAIGLLVAGGAALMPLVAGIVARISNNPQSARRVRRQLEAIRGESGVSDDESALI